MLTADPIVTVDTNFGNFQIELRPDAAPQTVANFLAYVESGAYTDSIFHRSVPGFIEQAGGFTSSSDTFSGDTSQFTTIPTNAPVPLEYDLPNITGSVAMARTKDPNSATDEWYVNLIDNTNNLGPASDGSGYTVFGQVIGNGMQVVNAIAALSVDNADNGGTFAQLPLGPNNELVRISSVTIDSIDGTVFSDTNSNGQLDAGEQGVAGRTIFIDQAGTGVYQSGDPIATTDSSGGYSFSGLAPGSYKIYEELPPNLSLTEPSQTVTVAANETASGTNFADAPSITGTVFTDSNGNGTLDAGETGLAGRTVFLNNDNTGVPDASNPSTVTDANGNYSFSGLAAGTYTVDETPPTGSTLTTTDLATTITTGGTAPVVDIGEMPPLIAGTVFTDINNNGKFDSGDVGIAGRTVFIDQDGSGHADGTNPQATTNSLGQFTLSGFAAGSYTVSEVLPSGGTLTTPAQTATVTTGQTASGLVFGELPSITGTVFVDLNGNGHKDSGEPGAGGQTVFLNIDGSGTPDTTNASTVTDSNGNFAFATEPAGNYPVEMVLSSNATLSAPSPSVTVTTGQTVSSVDLGVLPSITGTVFTDTNGNGLLDSGETGVAGRTVFLNLDGKGAPDTSNPSVTTDADGNYSFLALPAGNYPVMEVAPSGVTLTTSSQTATVTAGHDTSGVNIGEKAASSGGATATISGMVFDDVNVNGHLDTDETGLAGRTVFLNNDGTGQLNSNPSTTTDSAGNFSFTGLAAGNYTVMEVVPADHGVTLTSQIQTLALTAGQSVSGVDLGDALTSTIVPMAVSDAAPSASTDPNTAYINAVYQSVLGHAPDAPGLADWQQQLAAGADRITVAQGVWDSPEHWGMEVDQFYQTFLDRAPDAAGKAFWIDTFSKWGEQAVVAFFVTSPEYLALHAGTADFINALYNDVALRPATTDDLNYWEGQIAGGESQSQAARDFIFGQEANTQLIDGYYADYLHRAPDSAGLQNYLNALTSGASSAEQVAEQILATDEYFSNATGG